MARVN
jgi:hypothetical protein